MSAPTVLITGAAQGIGAAVADLMASRGWRIVVTDLNGEGAARTAMGLDERHPVAGGHRSGAVDVASVDSVRALTTELGLDALQGVVNCAGILLRQRAEEIDFDSWRRVVEVHLAGAALVTTSFLTPLIAGKGSVVNIASVASTLGLPGRSAYSAAKTGILGLTRTLAVEWGAYGVRVNAVAPGYVNTEMVRSGFRNGTLSEEKLVARTPLGRLAEAEDIATAIAFLLSTDSSFITGAVLKVDGGLTIEGTFE
jgi:NAD(P)-dependent dehydrogenase (short-subunit alcohol dehydrogenase family)